jgi:outer membrane protein assembly factor BamB
MLSTRRVFVVALGLAFLAALTLVPGASGQRAARMKRLIGPQPTQPTVNVPTKPGVFTDAITYDSRPEFKRYINAAQDCIRDKDWEKAAKALQEILDNKKDFSVEVAHKDPKTKQESTRRVSVRFEANRLIGDMPADGLDTYQNLYGGQARERLDEYKKTGDPAILAEVAQRYMHTRAGAEATDLLATYRLDRGDYFGAAESYKRLLALAKKRHKPIDISELTLFKAAMAFRRTGDRKDADNAWKALEPKIRRNGLRIGDATVSADRLEKALDDVEVPVIASQKDWPMWGGNVSRSAQADGSAPLLEEKWQWSIIHDEVEKTIGEAEAKHADTETWVKMATDAQERLALPVLSGFHPVAANGKLIYRTYGGLAAVWIKDGADAGGQHKAGELAWKSTFNGGLTNLLAESNYNQVMTEWKGMYSTSAHNMIIENSAVGTLTTDHGKVYAIDDLAIPPHPSWMQRWAWNGGQPAYPGDLRKLVNQSTLQAYDLESGKLVWELPDRNNPGDLADTHFLGTPLPVGGKLYVLNEKKSELRLLCLDPNKNGQLIRSQVLCGVKEPITRDITRRIHTVNLAYGEGILVVPTNAGAVLGVEILTQSLIWSYPYREGPPKPTMPVNPWGRPWGGQVMPVPTSNSEFKLAPPVITKGKVVFAAPDGESIHCVDLREGTRVWHVKRGDDFYLAGVFGDRVLMVRKNGFRILNLDTGTQVASKDTGMPCGQGVACNGIYYLPVRDKGKLPEIVTIDLAQGRVKAHNPFRTKADPRDLPGLGLGNLLFHEGALLSQSATHVAAYPRLDVKIREINLALAKQPNDPKWLTERGEMRLADGKTQGAVDDLRKALANNPPREILPTTRRKLYEAFTELFQTDFNYAAKNYLNEYRDMCKADDAVETSRRQARFLYLVGRGRENQGRLVDAYQAYVDFAALPSNEKEINDIDDSSLKAKPSVWVRGRIAAMMRSAAPAQRKPLEAKIAAEWQAIQSGNDVEALRRFVQTFDVPFQVGRQARLKLADALMEKNDKEAFLEAEMVLKQLEVAALEDDPETMGRALDGLARLEIRKGSIESMNLAARYYRTLADRYGKTVIRDGLTGAELFNELATDKRFLPYLEAAGQARITGKMKAREVNPANAAVNNANLTRLQSTFNFEPEGRNILPYFRTHRVMFNMQFRQIMLVDRTTGQEVGVINLPDLTNTQYYNYLYTYYNQPNLLPGASFRSCHVQGHLAVLQIGPMVYCVDVASKKVLWNRNLLETAVPINTNYNIQPDTDGSLQMITYDRFTNQPYRRKIGMIGNLEASYICIQTQKGLVALDPLRGAELWTKSDVPPRTQIFGDEQHVYLVETRDGVVTGNARCLRASDGVRVEVPDFSNAYQNRVRILGRKLLVSETGRDGLTLRLYDVHTGKDLWKKKFAAQSVALRTEDRNLAGAVEPNGQLTVVDLGSHKEVLNARLEEVDIKDVKEAVFLDDGDQFYLALNKAVDNTKVGNGGILYNNFANGTRCTLVNGMFYAFDRKGKLHWHSIEPITNQMVVLEQFKNMPIVLFSVRYNELAQGGRWNHWVTATKSINKKTGKLVYDSRPRDYSNPHQFYVLNLDAKKGTIDLIGGTNWVQHYVDDGRKFQDEGAGKGNLNQPQPKPVERLGPQKKDGVRINRGFGGRGRPLPQQKK